MRKIDILAALISCLLIASCRFGLEDDWIDIPVDPEWGSLLVDGAPQPPAEGVVRLKASDAPRSLEFRPLAAHGWSISGWNGLEPQPFPIADIPYRVDSLSGDNPWSVTIDKSFVSRYSHLVPRVDRFRIERFFAQGNGLTAFEIRYPDASRKIFVADAQGAGATDLTGLLPYPGGSRIEAMSETELLQLNSEGTPELKAFALGSGLVRSVVLGTDGDYIEVSPGGVLAGRETPRFIDGQRAGIGTLRIYRVATGAVLLTRDFSASAKIIRSAAICDAGIAYSASPPDSSSGDELRFIDAATGSDALIALPGPYSFVSAKPVAGSPSLLFVSGDPILPENPAMNEFRCFVYDAAANRLYPLQCDSLSFAASPVFAGPGRIYLSASFRNEVSSSPVLWDYPSDKYVSCGFAGTILYSTPQRAYMAASISPLSIGDSYCPVRSVILSGDPFGAQADITPYEAILR